jgi:hypothetical protein
MDRLNFFLDGHRLSDFSEGALVPCAKGSLAKGGWMDGTQKQRFFFLLAKCSQKGELIFLKI